MDRVRALGTIVAQHRRALGMTQGTVAERAGLHKNSVGLIERGATRVTLDALLALGDALGVPASELMAQAEQLASRRQLPRQRMKE
jgi:transcriptional regulator with XRE-family HTH domain